MSDNNPAPVVIYQEADQAIEVRLDAEQETAMALVRKTAGSPALDDASGRGLIDIVTRYPQTFLLMQRYDENLLTEPRPQAEAVVDQLAEQAEMGDLSRKTWRSCVSSRVAKLVEEHGGIPHITR